MERKNFKDIMSPVIEMDIEMRKAKEDWVNKIQGWRNFFTAGGKSTLLFSDVFDIFPEGEQGYFYRDLSLSNESVLSEHVEGTPVLIKSVNCSIHTEVNWSKNGEFYPCTYLYIEFIFCSISNDSWVKEHFPGELVWRPYLFYTYLDWPREYGKSGIGFATKEFISRSSFPGAGWTMIFNNDALRKSIIKKLKMVESNLHSLLPESSLTHNLLYKDSK